MKKFISTLLVALIFLLNNIIFVTTAETKPQQALEKQEVKPSDSLKFTELYNFSTKNNSNIKFLTTGSSIYITSCTPQAINVNNLKPIKVSTDGSKILVNRSNSLAKGYLPQNLTKISSNKIKLEHSILKLIPKTINALYSMIATAKKNHVKGFIINSAYRNENTQREIFNANLKIFRKTSKSYEEAYEKTRQLVALPGNSEHHTGLSLDIFSVNGLHRNDFVGTKEQIWLSQNLYKYGFIVRYPKDKTKQTNSAYEPWHIRFVGIPLSSYLYSENLCLEEFYDKIFAGNIVEDNDYIFMQIKDKQQIYIDKTMLSKAELETVSKGVMLLTINKN